MPQHLATPVPHGHSIRSRIAIAVDDSEYSPRALGYVGTLLRDARDVHVTLFHVLKPMPRELLEHRRVQREPMTGRGRVSLKARFMSAHTLKGSERNGYVPNRAALSLIATDRTTWTSKLLPSLKT